MYSKDATVSCLDCPLFQSNQYSIFEKGKSGAHRHALTVFSQFNQFAFFHCCHEIRVGPQRQDREKTPQTTPININILYCSMKTTFTPDILYFNYSHFYSTTLLLLLLQFSDANFMHICSTLEIIKVNIPIYQLAG